MVNWHGHVAPPSLAGRGDALTDSPIVIAAEYTGGQSVVDLAGEVTGGLGLALDERWGTRLQRLVEDLRSTLSVKHGCSATACRIGRAGTSTSISPSAVNTSSHGASLHALSTLGEDSTSLSALAVVPVVLGLVGIIIFHNFANVFVNVFLSCLLLTQWAGRVVPINFS